MHITMVGQNQWAIWDGYKLVRVCDSERDALDTLIGWDRSLWPWKSLYDVEHEAEKPRKKGK